MAEVLVIGSGGREQAIAQAVQSSHEVNRTHVSGDIQAGLDAFSGSNEKPFVIVGPEAPLVAGAADELRELGYTVLGASQKAAQYEASKSRSVKMMRAAGIQHPQTFIAEGNGMDERARFMTKGFDPEKYVIKADGLAGGKGVFLPDTKEEAQSVVDALLAGEYEGAGKEIINFSERHSGPEVSAMVVVGKGKDDFTILPLAQDHKRLLEGDLGPNTGGMGAYAPVPESIISTRDYHRIYEIVHDSLQGMEADGVRYENAVLYVGLMKSQQADNKPVVIEYNVRFGDPETQAILPLLVDVGVDVYRLLRSAAEGDGIEQPGIRLEKLGGAAITVCLAAASYPATPQKGDIIYGLERTYDNVTIQQAAVTTKDRHHVTNGGRVLYVTGVGKDIDTAAQHAYAAIGEEGIDFRGKQYRRDIGHQVRTM